MRRSRPASRRLSPRRLGATLFTGPGALFVAFAFTVMADPVSSVAYAIEAATRALHGDLGLLVATMALVVAVIVVVAVNYHQLIARYPGGGGAAAATADAFGDAWAFLPIAALIVDFGLTIAISVSAAGSALIAAVPGLAPGRTAIALALLAVVAGGTWFGHLGRIWFATMTLAFLGLSLVVVVAGAWATPLAAAATTHGGAGHAAAIAVVLAFPVALALATGVEAPSSAIAQLGQLDTDGRRRFGRATLWSMVAIVGLLTLGLAAIAVRLRAGVPGDDDTQLAMVARAAVGEPLASAYQAATALLLLAAASSSFQAGPGLLAALARRGGILPRGLARTNERYTPWRAVLVFVAVAGLVVLAAGGRDQELVLFYAVAVFVSFEAGLLAMARFARREGQHGAFALNAGGAAVVGFTLAANVARGHPLVSLAAAGAIAAALYARWVRVGRPGAT